jgi:hypothetical protein
VQGTFEVGRPPGMAAGSEQRSLLVLRGPFPIGTAGDYSWVLVLNGQRQPPTRFRVDHAQVLAPVQPPNRE